jgi:hypothetical protein
MRPSSPPLLFLITALLGCPTEPADEEPTPAPSTARQQQEFCADVTPTVEPSLIGFRTQTEHYVLDLAVDEDEATELARLAETTWSAFESYFPGDVDLGGEPLEAFLDVDETAWGDRIAADGLEVPWGAGGYFHTATDRAYLYAQPTVYFTRQLFLHELGHQFHAASADTLGHPAWWAEGTAEFIARHDWDGECVRLGVQPRLTYEDMPANAVEDLDAEPLDLGAWIDGDDFPGRPLMLELFRFFETHTERAPGWLAVRDAFDLGQPPDAAAIAALIGVDDLADIEADFDAFVRADLEPMAPIWLEWLHRTPTSVQGWAFNGVMTAAQVKATPDAMSVTADSPAVAGGASGLLVAWDGSDDHTIVLLFGDGAVSRWHIADGQLDWTDVATIDAPGDDPVSFAITGYGDDEVQVTIEGTAIDVPIEASPAAGLAVYDSDVIFEDLQLGAP